MNNQVNPDTRLTLWLPFALLCGVFTTMLIEVPAAQASITATGRFTRNWQPASATGLTYNGTDDPWIPTYDGSGTWDVATDSNELWMSRTAAATLTITAGSRVNVGADMHISGGWRNGPRGTVTVTGSGSLLYIGDDFTAGGNDNSSRSYADLTVNDGGVIQALDDVILWNLGTLTGDGTIRLGGDFTGHGTISPGNSGVGTLTVEGDVTLTSNSQLNIEISNSGVGDTLIVTGGTTIDSGASLTLLPTELITSTATYTVIDSGTALSGDYSVSSGYPLLSMSYATDGTTYDGKVTVTPVAYNNAAIVKTENQRAVGGALQTMLSQNPNNLLTQLQGASDAETLQDNYNALSGHNQLALAPVSNLMASGTLGTVSGRLAGLRTVARSHFRRERILASAKVRQSDQAPPVVLAQGMGNDPRLLGDTQWGLWGRYLNLHSDREGDENAVGYSYKMDGISVGIDQRYSDAWLWGLTGGYGMGRSDNGYAAQGEIENWHLGVYGMYNYEHGYLDLQFQGAYQDYYTRRPVTVGSLTEYNQGNTCGGSLGAAAELGFYVLETRFWSMRPMIGLQATYSHVEAYRETASNLSSLRIGEQQMMSLKSFLGLKSIRWFEGEEEGTDTALSMRGGWEHEFDDTANSANVAFNGLPGSSFDVTGSHVARDSFLLGAGLHGMLAPTTWLSFDVDYRVNEDEEAVLFRGTLSHRW